MTFQDLYKKGYLLESQFWWDALRAIGWAICKGLYVIYELILDFFNKVLGLFTFSTGKEVNLLFGTETADGVKPFFGTYSFPFQVVLVLSLIIFGVIAIFSDNRPKLLQNFLLGFAVWALLPYVMTQFNTAIQSDFANEKDNISNIEWTTYVDDVEELAKNGNGNGKGKLTDIIILDVNETVKIDKLKHHYEGGNVVPGFKEEDWKIIKFSHPYYKYHINFLAFAVNYIIFIIAFACISFKLFKIMWELIQSRFLAIIFAAEINSGQKTKKIIEYTLHSYLTVYVILFSIRLLDVILIRIEAMDANDVEKILFKLFATLLFIDGPNVAERILGIDAGLEKHTMYLLAQKTTDSIEKAFKKNKNKNKNGEGENNSNNQPNKTSGNQPNKTNGNQPNKTSGVNASSNNTNSNSNNQESINQPNIDSKNSNSSDQETNNSINPNISSSNNRTAASNNNNNLNNNANNNDYVKSTNNQSDHSQSTPNDNTQTNNEQPNISSESNLPGSSDNLKSDFSNATQPDINSTGFNSNDDYNNKLYNPYFDNPGTLDNIGNDKNNSQGYLNQPNQSNYNNVNSFNNTKSENLHTSNMNQTSNRYSESNNINNARSQGKSFGIKKPRRK